VQYIGELNHYDSIHQCIALYQTKEYICNVLFRRYNQTKE